jgi:hypothetical protein
MSKDILNVRRVCRAWNREATKVLQLKNLGELFFDLETANTLREISTLNLLLESPDGNFPSTISLGVNLRCQRETCPTQAEATEWTLALGRLLANVSPHVEQLDLNFSHSNCSVQLLDIICQERIQSFPRLWSLDLSKKLSCCRVKSKEPETESKALSDVGDKLLRLAPDLKSFSISWYPLQRELKPEEALPEDELLRSLPPKINVLFIEKTFSRTAVELLASAHLPDLEFLSLSFCQYSFITESSLYNILEGVSSVGQNMSVVWICKQE